MRSRVRIGQRYKRIIKEKEEKGQCAERKEVWIVKEIYPYHAVCELENGSRRESFTYFDMKNMRRL